LNQTVDIGVGANAASGGEQPGVDRSGGDSQFICVINQRQTHRLERPGEGQSGPLAWLKARYEVAE
jgi:hypothetical protein